MPGRNMVLTGVDQDSLERHFRAGIAGEGRESPFAPVYVLTGSNSASLQLRRRLADSCGCFCNLRFVTFKDLAESLLRGHEGWFNRTPLPPGATYRLAVGAARSMGPVSAYAPIADSPGFPRVLEDAIRNMRETTGGEPIPLQSLPEGSAAHVLASAHNAVSDALSRYRDGVGLLGLAAVRAEGFQALTGCGRLVVFGVNDPTPGQRRLLEAVSRHAGVTHYLSWSPDSGADDRHSVLSWLLGLGYGHAMIDPVPGGYGLKGITDLRVLTVPQYRMQPGAGGVGAGADGSVSILACPGMDREVRELARECVGLAESGIPFREMAIVLRNPGGYRGLIRDAFGAAGLPLHMPGAVPFADKPYCRAALMLLDLRGSGYPRRKVCAFLEDAPLKGGADKAGQWTRLARLAGVIGTREQWSDRLRWMMAPRDRGDGSPTVDADGKDAGQLLELMEGVFDALEALPAHASWSVHGSAVVGLCESFLEPIDGYNEWLETVGSLAGLDAVEDSVGFADFRTTLNLELGTRSADIGRFEGGGINVLPATAMGGMSFDAVLIPGMLEKGFPTASKGNPLLTEGVRESLASACGHRFTGMAKSQDDEMALFRTIIGSARKRLLLSYPTVDGVTGRELSPSPFIPWVASVLTGKRVSAEGLLKEVPQFRRIRLSRLSPDERRECVTDREYDLWAMEHYPQASRTYARMANPCLGLPLDGDASRWSPQDLGPWDGDAATPETMAYLRASSPVNKAVSPTVMEGFCRCPFSGFLRTVLGVEAVEEPETPWNMDNRDFGTTIHSILEGFYGRAAAKDWSQAPRAGEDKLSATLREVAEPILDGLASAGRAAYGAIWAHERRTMLRGVESYLRAELGAPFGTDEPQTPDGVLLEVPFGSKDSPVSIPLPDGRTVRLRGRADRIDKHSDGRVLVVDYKTGKPKGKDGTLKGGEHLQLPLYSLAAPGILGDGTDPRNVTAEYHYMMAGLNGGKKVSFTALHLEDRMDDLLAILGWLDDTVTAGKFPQNPGKDKGNCAYCPYAPACGVNVDLMSATKAGSPHVQYHLRVRSCE